MKKFLEKYKIFILSLFTFLVITTVYFPNLLIGEKLTGTDVGTFQGMSNEIDQHYRITGERTLWSNSAFGGMPSYLTSSPDPGNIFKYLSSLYDKYKIPANFILINFILFFILSVLITRNKYNAIIGSLAYGLNTFMFVILATGHITKGHALIYMPIIVAGVIYAYQKNSIKGSLLAAIGFGFMLNANHPQMTYYAGIMIATIGLTYLIFAIKEKTIISFLKTSAILFFAAILAFGTAFSRLYTIAEYGKYSTRGQSELKADDDQTSGLDKSYILDYSYDLGEAMTAFIPRFKGGGMAENLGENSAFYKELKKSQGAKGAKSIAERSPLYWGSQPIATAPFYYGAVLCFLFVLGLFLVKGKDKWWIIITVVISLLLSLGKNIPALAHFMIDYFPGYNKFRDVKNIIVIQQFAMAVMGILAVKEVYERKIDSKKFFNSLKWAFGITGGLALIFVLLPGLAGDFVGKTDAQYAQMGWPQQLLDALQIDRKTVLRADAFRTFIFVALAAGTLWAYWTKKIKAQYALVIWGVLVIADMWPINKRYLNNDDFVAKKQAETPFKPSLADTEIQKDKSLDYRVLNLTVNPWSDASTSYFHKSIGGYHGAKMQRYQEMIEHRLSPEISMLQNRAGNMKTQVDMDNLFVGLNGLNMLNTKYVIGNPQRPPIVNPSAMGNAWFVSNIEIVADANEEIEKIGAINITNTAVVDTRYSELVPTNIQTDSTATITLNSYAPNKLVYKTSLQEEQVAVFSEIFYPKGWYAYIDGQEAPIFCANYILRAMAVPAGEHEIVFEFKPKSYEIGNKVSFASSLILLLAVAGVIFVEIRKRKAQPSNE